MEQFFHSVTLDKEACKGCINCVKRCPTEAIRVRSGKAHIIKERCIDCGECIRVCPHHAKKPIFDPLSVMEAYPYTVALPAPALYGQFNNMDDVDIILDGLLRMGFDHVYEVAKAAEIVSDCTRKLMQSGGLSRPVISSACPAVLRLIRVRFPQLLDNVLPLQAPMELAARMAKEEAMKKTGLAEKDIGVIFISPCPAKVTAVKMPLGAQKSAVDAVVAISEVYPKLLAHMEEGGEVKELADAGRMGIGWGGSGGEAAASLHERHLAADGIENVIKVLEELEDQKFSDLDFVELNACSGGCVGGVLTVENPYIAKAKLKRISRYRAVSYNHIDEALPPEAGWDTPVRYEPVMQLHKDLATSMQMMNKMQEIESQLYGLDCGSCGAPSCRALAEDIVRGFSTMDACIYILRDKVETFAEGMKSITTRLPHQSKAAEREPEHAGTTINKGND